MNKIYTIVGILALILVSGILWYVGKGSSFATSPSTTIAPLAIATSTHGMSQYLDTANNFAFWYPSALHVLSSTMNDTLLFPGGVTVENLQVGDVGGTVIYVVNSPSSTVTDEANGHASPIAQTTFFYASTTGKWMVAYPEGEGNGTMRATTSADVSRKTIAGLPMLQSSRRFNTTIIPLTASRFLVITDGGGSMFSSALAITVTPVGTVVDALLLSDVLRSEADAYASM